MPGSLRIELMLSERLQGERESMENSVSGIIYSVFVHIVNMTITRKQLSTAMWERDKPEGH